MAQRATNAKVLRNLTGLRVYDSIPKGFPDLQNLTKNATPTVVQFSETLEKMIAVADQIAEAENRLAMGVADPKSLVMETQSRNGALRDLWQTLRTCTAAQCHDELIRRAIVADRCWEESHITGCEGLVGQIADADWAMVDKARKVLELDRICEAEYLGPCPPCVNDVLERLGML